MKCCFKLGTSAWETLAFRKQAYGDDALSRTRVLEWHKMFKEGRELVRDEHHVASSMTQVAKVKEVLDTDRP